MLTSSVNPSDRDTVEGGGCTHGCGADIAGRVVACPGCHRLKVGDNVLTLGSPAYAEYAVVPEDRTGLKPSSLDFLPAGTIPEVGLTSWLSLKRSGSTFPSPLPAGSPWPAVKYPNLTIAITAGSGGTGFIAIEMAKAWGAKHILTSTSGVAGFSFVRSLGATWVSDYVRRHRPVMNEQSCASTKHHNDVASTSDTVCMLSIIPLCRKLEICLMSWAIIQVDALVVVECNPQPFVAT